MVGLLHAMTFMVLLLVGLVIWNNKPLPLPSDDCCFYGLYQTKSFKICKNIGDKKQRFIALLSAYLSKNLTETLATKATDRENIISFGAVVVDDLPRLFCFTIPIRSGTRPLELRPAGQLHHVTTTVLPRGNCITWTFTSADQKPFHLLHTTVYQKLTIQTIQVAFIKNRNQI